MSEKRCKTCGQITKEYRVELWRKGMINKYGKDYKGVMHEWQIKGGQKTKKVWNDKIRPVDK